jgi:hypothetical protein
MIASYYAGRVGCWGSKYGLELSNIDISSLDCSAYFEPTYLHDQ